MSLIDKRSLWQKIKRRLAAALLRMVEDDSAVKATSSPASMPKYPIVAENITAENTKADGIENAESKNTKIADKDANNHFNSDSHSDHSKNEDLENRKSENRASENSNLEKNSLEKDSVKNQDANDHYNDAQDASAPTDMSIVDYLKQYFYDKDWHYTYYRPRASDSQQSHHLSLQMRNKQIECGYLFRVQEANNLLAVYGILPFLIPESHQSAAMLLITQINYDMLIGNLEMDINDGEIRYKNAIDIEAVGIDDHIMEHLLQNVIAMTTVTYEIFSDLINTANPAEDMATLLSELRQQADARTFYLPTQFVQ